MHVTAGSFDWAPVSYCARSGARSMATPVLRPDLEVTVHCGGSTNRGALSLKIVKQVNSVFI